VKRPPAKPENPIEPEDAALFRAAAGKVQPVPAQNRVEPQRPLRKPARRAPAPPPTVPDTLSDSGAEHAPDEFLRDGLSRMTLRKLRRQPVQDCLDLHGSTAEAARRLLQVFLHEAGQRGLRCLLVIHGKGMNSPGGTAVLRKLARHWLAQHPGVLAFCDAPPGEGGSGAVRVLLKASPG
jgi:DNA-nicking Smr family endonuclease